MFNFSSTPRRKNTKAARVRKLKAKIAKKEKKLKADAELRNLQKKWDSIKSR